jgi:hypothetical protein
MKNYIHNMRQKAPHERRQAAMRIAATVTAVLFLGWVATLGVRLATPSAKTAQQSSFESQVASIISAFSLSGAKPNTLQVASTTNNF